MRVSLFTSSDQPTQSAQSKSNDVSHNGSYVDRTARIKIYLDFVISFIRYSSPVVIFGILLCRNVDLVKSLSIPVLTQLANIAYDFMKKS